MNRLPDHPPARRSQAGLGLIELLAVIAVAAVLVGNSLPSLKSMVERQRLVAAAAQLETDLQLARGAAVAANRVLQMDFPVAGRCYVLHDGAPGSCRCADDGQPVCEPGTTAWRSASFAVDRPLQLASNVRSMAFDPVQGTVTPTATLRLTAPVGQVRLVINIMGRIRSCSPDAAVPGFLAC